MARTAQQRWGWRNEKYVLLTEFDATPVPDAGTQDRPHADSVATYEDVLDAASDCGCPAIEYAVWREWGDMVNAEDKGRYFASGAYRDSDDGKLDFEGFYHPLVMERFARYMDKNRRQSDGRLRGSDNWQAGIPKSEYMKSGMRHFMDWWACHRGTPIREDDIEEAICGLLFNAQGYLFELLKEQQS